MFETAFVGLISAVSAWFAWRASRHASDTSDAVNHVHRNGDGAKRIYDLVISNSEGIHDLHRLAAKADERLDKLTDMAEQNVNEHSVLFEQVDEIRRKVDCECTEEKSDDATET